MFSYCNNLTTIPELDFSNVENMDEIFIFCDELSSIGIKNFKCSLDLSYCFLLDDEALNTVFDNASTPIDSEQEINIQNCMGAASCDRTIATDKGWNIVG